MVTRSILALVAALTVATSAHALEPGASEIFSLVNGTLSSSCTANTVVTGGSPLACSATLPSQVAVSGSAITLATSVSTTANRLARDATLNRLRYGDGTNAQIVDTSAVNAQAYLACDGTTDDRAALATLIQTGGACAGKDCVIPAGCLVLLSSPGAGSAAVSIPTGTRVICEDRTTSTFRLARHYCSGGNQPGSWADATVTCRSGTKACDVGADADNCEFAPTSGSTYTVFKSDASAAKPSIIGCKFDLRQIEAYGRCAGGSQSGKACSTADTNATTGCPSSTCTVDPEEPSGDGKIIAIDFSAATDATVDDVEVYNAKYSDYVVRISTGGVARRLQIDSYDTNTPAVVPTFSLASLLTLNAASVFDSSFGRGTIGVDAGSSASIVSNNRFTNTTSGIAGTGKLTAQGNKIDLLSGTTGYAIAAGDYSIISDNAITNAQDGIRVGSYSEITSNNVISTKNGIIPNPAVAGSGSRNQISANIVSGQSRVGAELFQYNQLVGNMFSGGSVSDTSTSPVTPSAAVTSSYVQNIIADNYITGSWFFGIHPRAVPNSFNTGVWNNRFAFGPVGPAIVTGGAGWHLNDNYINQVAGGWCSDPTASNYLGACTCTTQQCSAGTNLGANCATLGSNVGECGTAGVCSTVDTTVDNPYGKYGGVTGTCFAFNNQNSGGTCDSTPTYSKSDCTYSPAIVVGVDASLPGATSYSSVSHPSFVLTGGTGTTSAHVKIEGNIIARGTGSTDIDFADPKICSGTFLPACQGSGGNAGQSCAYDSDCTSTGCVWGAGNCCGSGSKLCSSTTDCISKQCDKTSSPSSLWGTSCTSDAGCGGIGSSCDTVSNQCNSTSTISGAPGKVCTTDSDCGDTTGTQCQASTVTCGGSTHLDVSLTSNYFYPGFQALDAGLVNSQISGLIFANNDIDASVRGVKLPNPAATPLPVSGAIVNANRFALGARGSGYELENWATTYGLARHNYGLSGSEYENTSVYLQNRAGGQLTAGYAVELLTTVYDGGIKHAIAGSGQNAIGILAEACSATAGTPCRVVTDGVTDCYVSATVARGDRLMVDGSVDGNLVTSTSTNPSFARALAARSGAGLVKCLVKSEAPTTTLATSGVILSGAQGMIGTATRYMIMGRTDNPTSTSSEAGAAIAFPQGTIQKMSCALSAAPGASKSRTFTLMKAGIAQSMTCTITGGSATACTDTSHAVTIASAGETLSVRSEVASSPANSDVLCAFAYAVTGF